MITEEQARVGLLVVYKTPSCRYVCRIESIRREERYNYVYYTVQQLLTKNGDSLKKHGFVKTVGKWNITPLEDYIEEIRKEQENLTNFFETYYSKVHNLTTNGNNISTV